VPPTVVLTAQIEALELEILATEGRASALMVASASGDATAAAEAARLRSKRRAMEQELADLRGGLQLAIQQSAVVAAEVRKTQEEAGREEVRQLIAMRIEVAADFDRAMSQAQTAYSRFSSLGVELDGHLQSPFATVGNQGMALYENIRGLNRVMAALPPMIRAFFPQAQLPADQVALAESEAGLWPVALTPKGSA
jgi:hypothetical protein